MSSNPIKLFAFAGVVAVIAGGVLGQNVEPDLLTRTAGNSPTTAKTSWWSDLFANYEFSRERVPPTPAPPPKVATASTETPIRKASGFGSVVLSPDRGGQFHAQVEIDGQRLQMLVDTGATAVALRYEDAERLGIMPAPSDFVLPIATANGELKAAATRLREVRLENIIVPDVRAVVLPQGALGQSLLGMTFMSRLAGYETSGGQLVLKP